MPFAKAMPGISSALSGGLGQLSGLYGAVGKATRGLGVGMFRAGGAQHIMSYAPGYLGKGLMAAGRSSVGTSALTGGLAGGAYGAMSSDTSIIGGALTGAALGAGGVGAARMGRGGLGMYNYMKHSAGRGQAARAAFSHMGGMAKSYFGNQYTRAANAFRGMR